jgi:hypothetical protein
MLEIKDYRIFPNRNCIMRVEILARAEAYA